VSAGDWNSYLTAYAGRLKEEFSADESPADFAGRIGAYDPVVKLSGLGWFLAESAAEYEAHVTGILSDLILRPKTRTEELADARAKRSRINSEIATELSKLRILAGRKETIDDHKVARDYYVSVAENLRADFAAKNGVYHITSTLDLRRDSVHIKEACWKACVLEEARRLLGDGTHRLGVYAADYDATQFRGHIEILKGYSTRTFNWLNPEERYAYRLAMIAAIQKIGPVLGVDPQ
jgi:hypothetical protein